MQDPQKPKPFDAAKADAQAKAILSQGGSQSDVDAYLHETYGLTPHDDGPGVISRGLSKFGAGLARVVTHPQDMVIEPIKSAFNATVSPGVGEARPDARLSKGGNSSGRAIDTSPYDAEHGGITPKERTQAGVSTVANIASPGIFRGVTSLAAPVIGKTFGAGAGLMASGATTGAASNLDDPFAGAIAGGLTAPVMGAVTAGVTKGAGKALDLKAKYGQVKKAPTLGADAVAREADIKAVDTQNYGQAAKEGDAAGGSTPPLQTALAHKRVKPYADMVRNSDAGHGADDATVARETYKLMSQEMKGLKMRMDRDGFDAKASLQIGDLKAGMKRLKNATTQESTVPAVTKTVDTFERQPTVSPEREPASGPVQEKNLSEYTSAPTDPSIQQALRDAPSPSVPRMQGPGGPAFQLRASPPQEVGAGRRVKTGQAEVEVSPARDVPPAMPSFPGAVAEHAARERAMELSQQGGDAAKRVMFDRSLPGKKQATQSKEAVLDRIGGMSNDEARDYLTGVLGRGKEGVKIHAPNATSTSKLANIVQPLTRLNRLSPLVDALERRQGKSPTLPQRMMDPRVTDQILQLMGIPAGAITKP